MNLKFVFSISFFLINIGLFAQSKGIVNQSLEHQFQTPPTSAKPYVWWHWMGSNFSKAGITKDLEAMKAQGIGGATIFNLSSAVQESHAPTLNNPWPNQTYRSTAYWDALKHAIAEAKRLGLELGIHNTVGYSTTGGPWITEERAMKKLVWTKRIITENEADTIVIAKPATVVDLNGWGRRNLPPVPSTWYKDIAYLAIALKDSNRYENCIDVSNHFDTTGKMVKPLPQGNWIVYRMGYAPTMSTPHPIPDEILTTCLEADKMSATQSRYHWNKVIDPMKQYFGKDFGSSFKHMLIDSYEAGYQNWTDSFRTEFIKRKSYDPLPWLLTFSGAVSFNSTKNAEQRLRYNKEETARFDWDFRDVISQLYHEKGWMTAKSLLQKNNLQLQFEAYGGPFNSVRGSALADIPMTEFWTARKVAFGSAVAGAARAAGKHIVGAEAFTGSPSVSQFTEDPAFLKPSAIGAYGLGVNRLVLHHWVHQPFDDKYQPGMGMGWWGTHFSRFQTWAEPGKAFFNYLAKTQAMLQYGEQVSSFLCLEKNTEEQSDVIATEDFLEQHIQVVDGKIVLPSGRKYPFLVLPEGNKILLEVLLKLEVLVKKGAVIVGTKPTQSYSLSNYPKCDEQISTLANTLWNNELNKKYLVFNTKTEALKYLAIEPDWMVKDADSAHLIKCIHRTGKSGEVYYVANIHKQSQVVTLSFKQSNLQPEIWNPEDGTITNALIWNEVNGRTNVQLTLNDNQALFVVFRKKANSIVHATSLKVVEGNALIGVHNQLKPIIFANAAATVSVTYSDNKTQSFIFSKPDTIALQNNWQVHFIPKIDTPFKLAFTQLIDFSKHPNNKVKYFAGTAIYKQIISINAIDYSKKVLLDLGMLNDIASVKINDQNAGVLWYPPYQVDVTNLLLKGNNSIEVAVTNNWANRLIGDEQEPADFEWGSDRGANGRAMKAYPDWFINNKSRPSQGRKTFSVWYYYRPDSKLQPAGLVGPVQFIYQDVKEL